MENKNKKKKQNLYSKFRLWCLKYHIPFVIFPISILVGLGILTIVIYDLIAPDFSLGAVLTSPSAILIYILLIVAIIAFVGWQLLRHFGGK